MRINRHIMSAMQKSISADTQSQALRRSSAEQHAIQTKRIVHNAMQNNIKTMQMTRFISTVSSVSSSLSKVQANPVPQNSVEGKPATPAAESPKSSEISGMNVATQVVSKAADLAKAMSTHTQTRSNTRKELAESASSSRKRFSQSTGNIAQAQAEALLQSYTEA